VSRRRGPVVPGTLYHAVNRAIEGHQLFHEAAEYAAFIALMLAARRRYALDLLAYCLMPNHWHLIVRPLEKDALSAYMQWLAARHVSHYRRERRTTGRGHLYQARFFSSPIETDVYFWTAFIYVEGNAQRAKLTERAEDWEWGSLYERKNPSSNLIVPPALPLPPNWTDLVNAGLQQVELQEMREKFRRGVPYRPARLAGV
jgi:putative transposase